MDEAVIRIFLAMHGRAPALDALVVFCAAVVPYFLALGFLIAGVMLFPRNLSRPFASAKQRLYFILSTGLALLLSRGMVAPLIRFVYPVARPFAAMHFTPLIAHTVNDPSFPSGHATVLFALALALWPQNKRWGIYMFAGAVINAVARVYVGVHWPSDVAAGAIIGAAAVVLVQKYTPKP